MIALFEIYVRKNAILNLKMANSCICSIEITLNHFQYIDLMASSLKKET